VRLPAFAAAAQRIKAKSLMIDGEAVVVGPDGLSRFEELRRREAAHKAILYAFDLIEHDGEDLRSRPFLDRKAALARLLRGTEAVSRSTNTLPRTVPPYSSTPVSTPSQRNRSCPQIQPCATSGQAEMLKKLYAGDAAQTVWGDQNLRNRAPR
jgi:hypothetical protein